MVDCKPTTTPLCASHKLYLADSPSFDQPTLYRSTGTMALGLIFRHVTRLLLEGYSDADWASSLDDRRSIGGHDLMLGGNLLTWSSKKQRVVARSSVESEYRSLANLTTDIVWLHSLLSEIGVKFLCHKLPIGYVTSSGSNSGAGLVQLQWEMLDEQLQERLI
ncbi:hypothetical protein DH2020_018367 [Rehmannia glutinosa]|uniref:Uncharacterized protein n=1 Tax=Rehmannia glutinosa TaxID=99300 RepID=A0ABR0WJV9_REHGL